MPTNKDISRAIHAPHVNRPRDRVPSPIMFQDSSDAYAVPGPKVKIFETPLLAQLHAHRTITNDHKFTLFLICLHPSEPGFYLTALEDRPQAQNWLEDRGFNVVVRR